MTCPIHGEFKGFTCRSCFEQKEEKLSLDRFLTFPTATFKTIIRREKSHAVIPGWGKKTLCGHTFSSEKDLGISRLKTDKDQVTCSECLKVGWPV
jgi:hypothetical protein